MAGVAVALAAVAPALVLARVDADASVRSPRAEDRHAPLRRACAWLWARQAADGGWHSETYGLLRSGQALTPFVLEALIRVPEELAPRPPGGVERGLAFIREHVAADGRMGMSIAGLPEYPTYATAYGLACLVRAGDARDRELIARMRAALLASQLGRDLPEDHVAQGGWGFGVRPPGHPGHVDLSHTRHALEALALAGSDREVSGRALRFLALLQKVDPRPQPPANDVGVPSDGGFYFSPIVLAASKGNEEERDGKRWMRSYASATADGLLALLAAGVAKDDPRVQAAAAWLRAHPRLDEPEGIPAGGNERWARSIAHYHLMVRAEANAALGEPGPWREEIARSLSALQREDGSFVNEEGHLMKEDDPLLCTALAVVALVS